MKIESTEMMGPVRYAHCTDGWTLVYNWMAGEHHGRLIHGFRGDSEDAVYLGDDGQPDLTPEDARELLERYDEERAR